MSRRTGWNISSVAAVVLAFVLSVGLLSCGGGKKEAPPKPSGVTEQKEAPAKAEAPAVPQGKLLVERVCTACHTLDRVNKAKKDRAGWESTVDRMIKMGAQVTEEQKQVIVDYLSGQK
ncbi:MAG: hypothetical protein D6713_00875 [Deltaproteobacteria bacterium]|nr:MAG: hypothetical protein D6713_00875 [Deltaproteobacteria bacterium]